MEVTSIDISPNDKFSASMSHYLASNKLRNFQRATNSEIVL